MRQAITKLLIIFTNFTDNIKNIHRQTCSQAYISAVLPKLSRAFASAPYFVSRPIRAFEPELKKNIRQFVKLNKVIYYKAMTKN